MELELYIQIENGVAINHPILGDNLRQVIPDIDTDNLPSNYAKFMRCPALVLGPYDIYKGVRYELIGDGVYTDVHVIEQVSAKEKQALQSIAKKRWDNAYPSWVFNEDTCAFAPPIPYPTDGSVYVWCEPDQTWNLAPEQPSNNLPDVSPDAI
jgi:hypothetical protein